MKEDELIESRNIVIFTASSNQDLLKEIENSGVKEIFKKRFFGSFDKIDTKVP
jgi:hypothetical protein